MAEHKIERSFIEKLGDIKHTYRPDIREHTTLELDFCEKFEALTGCGVAKFSINYPESDKKITICLSSLDSMIAAKVENLDALKTHKKGLMQQLVPAVEVKE